MAPTNMDKIILTVQMTGGLCSPNSQTFRGGEGGLGMRLVQLKITMVENLGETFKTVN